MAACLAKARRGCAWRPCWYAGRCPRTSDWMLCQERGFPVMWLTHPWLMGFRVWGVALFPASAAMSPAGAGADGFGSRFFQTVVEDRLWMRRGPAVGQHLLKTHVIRM